MPTLTPSFYEGIPEETRVELELLPHQERFAKLATVKELTPRDLLHFLSQKSGLPVCEGFELVPQPTESIPLRLIHEYQCLPIETPEKSDEPGTISLVTLWPPEERADRWIHAVCGLRPKWYLALAEEVNNTITQNFGVGAGSLEASEMELEEADSDDTEEDEDAAVIRFVNEVVQKAVVDRATDIHFEPHRETLRIRYRIDGNLVSVRVPDNLVRFQDAIISRLKIMAKLNISEKRRPQDGRITFGAGKNELDIRISTFPTMYGESISLRLLSQKSAPISMLELGLRPNEEEKITRALTSPHGIILVTGPTGSGKSTSLTAYIRTINSPERRIITVEDPVEYEVPGVNQTQVRTEIGLNFASALRHILRQDPDVIMVGEIRDRETADIAIRASLTGHLVLSTLHTNDAPGALTRLIDMEIEPFLIASSVELIVAQRLVRQLCPKCSRPANLEPGMGETCLAAMRIDPSEAAHLHLAREAVGCEACNGIGFRGRIGLFEILRVSEGIHELIVQRASARLIRQKALQEGMRSLMQSGWEHVKNGMTTIEEIMRYAELEEEDASVENSKAN